MATPSVTPQLPSPADERFAFLVASGEMNQSDAYKATHNVSAEALPATTYVNASHLATKLRPRIEEIAAQIHNAQLQKHVWDTERLIDEAETNLNGSRSAKQWGSANGALEIIGRATGLLSDKPRDQGATITRITVVLNHGADQETGAARITEASYNLLPDADKAALEAPGHKPEPAQDTGNT